MVGMVCNGITFIPNLQNVNFSKVQRGRANARSHARAQTHTQQNTQDFNLISLKEIRFKV
jgi:hypothetical protein